MYTRSMFLTADMIEQHRLLTRVADLSDSGVLRSTLAARFGAINAANLRRAHALLESGKARGKIVLSGFQGAVKKLVCHLGGSGGMRCKARAGVIASNVDDEQRRSAPVRADPNVTVILEWLLSGPGCRARFHFYLNNHISYENKSSNCMEGRRPTDDRRSGPGRA